MSFSAPSLQRFYQQADVLCFPVVSKNIATFIYFSEMWCLPQHFIPVTLLKADHSELVSKTSVWFQTPFIWPLLCILRCVPQGSSTSLPLSASCSFLVFLIYHSHWETCCDCQELFWFFVRKKHISSQCWAAFADHHHGGRQHGSLTIFIL